MAYPKEIQDLMKSIPKEHHKAIGKIIHFYYNEGVMDVQNLVAGIAKIKPHNIKDYGVYNSDDLAGG